MEILDKVTSIILTLLAACIAFKTVYIVIGTFFKSRKYPDTDIRKKYAIIISARNEENVIGNLLDSLHKQNYPKELLTIFVVADNCSDNTAQICRDKGAVVYERHDPSKARKGWALEFLFDNIKKDYGIESFDGYIFFDADNLVDSNFVLEINKAIVSGAKIATGYRNTKNFSTNFISFSYGMHFCRNTLCNHRPRSKIHTTTHLAGTGHCISSEILKDGWRWHTLTEDAELTMEVVGKGEIIHYCEKAEFYDEQPTNFIVAWRQRLRWTRGRLICFFKKGGELVSGLFKRKRSIASRWSCYDDFWYMFPYALFTLFIGAIYPVTSAIISLVNGLPLPWLSWLKTLGTTLLTSYITYFLNGVLTLIREYKHIKCPWYKQVLYLFLWPWFDMINEPLLICSTFIPVKWTPIIHKDQTKIEMLENSEEKIDIQNNEQISKEENQEFVVEDKGVDNKEITKENGNT